MTTCAHCNESTRLMVEDVCADCYWEEDSKRKRAIRSSPVWLFQRAYSAAVQVMGKTHDEALIIATQSLETKFGTK